MVFIMRKSSYFCGEISIYSMTQVKLKNSKRRHIFWGKFKTIKIKIEGQIESEKTDEEKQNMGEKNCTKIKIFTPRNEEHSKLAVK